MFEVLEKEMVISVCMFACLLLSLFARVLSWGALSEYDSGNR